MLEFITRESGLIHESHHSNPSAVQRARTYARNPAREREPRFIKTDDMRGVFPASELGVSVRTREDIDDATRSSSSSSSSSSKREVASARSSESQSRSALLVIDVQNDFLPPNGALAVPGGDEIVAACSDLVEQFERVVYSQDYHPAGHSSFASSHPNAAPYDVVTVSYGEQTLWPDHCVQGTKGCAFSPGLVVTDKVMVVRKGYNPDVDSYSAFYENDKSSDTGLREYLDAEGVDTVYIVGLAYDFCVKYTALDAKRLGYRVVLVRDCCRGVGLPGTMESADAELAAAGVEFENTVSV